jgi:pimeloyl-ACP methyl ester carboxylesterase/class 3 adenylate cyclase
MPPETVPPETRYAHSGDVAIAYQVVGQGPIDIVFVPGLVSNVEMLHEMPGYTDFFDRLAGFSRVVSFDKRGQGLSDRIAGAPTLEERADDLRAVMDALGMTRVVVIGNSEGSMMAAYFAAMFPGKVSHLVILAGFAKFSRSEDYPWSTMTEQNAQWAAKAWGTGKVFRAINPGFVNSPERLALAARFERQSCSPGNFKAIYDLNMKLDIRPLLPQIQVPTLILHRKTDAAVPIEIARHLAREIPGARLIEQDTGDHFFSLGDYPAFCSEIEEFVTGERTDAPVTVERILATVLFTDIVDSTSNAATLGDAEWRAKLDEHDRAARRLVEQYRGRLIKTTGDGVLATFDGPGRAIRCALGMISALGRLGLPVRAGLHTGEIEDRGDDIGGIAIHAAARVMAKAQAREVLVSRVVADLVAGSGIAFVDRGDTDLRGLPGAWRLFAASL